MASVTLVFLICTLFSYAFAASFPLNSEPKGPALPRCQQPPESSLCLAYLRRFFFNATTGKCHNFVYGGCRGNENNFFTEEECLQACAGNKEQAAKIETESLEENNVVDSSAAPQASASASAEDVCSLPQDPGLCYALFEKFYFNGEKCEAFNYGGCGGNKNNFQTEEECAKACPPKMQAK